MPEEHDELRRVIDALTYAAHHYRNVLRIVEEHCDEETRETIAVFNPILEETDVFIDEWELKCGYAAP